MKLEQIYQGPIGENLEKIDEVKKQYKKRQSVINTRARTVTIYAIS